MRFKRIKPGQLLYRKAWKKIVNREIFYYIKAKDYKPRVGKYFEVSKITTIKGKIDYVEEIYFRKGDVRNDFTEVIDEAEKKRILEQLWFHSL